MRLMTMSDIARSIGVSRQRVFIAAAEDPDFPEPVFDSPRRRLWAAEEVERWRRVRSARSGKRKPRRP